MKELTQIKETEGLNTGAFYSEDVTGTVVKHEWGQRKVLWPSLWM